jgi:DNA polymerase III sliding clamp (beta) subunit (PCNA family)
MLDALRFVVPAIAKKDYLPELAHYRIRDGRITAFNGMFSLSSPIGIDIDVQPKASSFFAAVKACPELISLHVTATKRLAIKSGKFKAYIECLDTVVQHEVAPEGTLIDLGPNFMEGIKSIAPLMGVDASRFWAMGIKLQKESMFATNNVTLVEYWHGHDIPIDVVIPSQAINELLRIGEPPAKVQVTENSISFWFENDRWLRTQLLDTEGWPTDRMQELINNSKNELVVLDDSFREALSVLKPFMDEHSSIYITSKGLSTTKEEETGAKVELDLNSIEGMHCYNHTNLSLLLETADRIDWSSYPKPCYFRKGDRQRGVIIGKRL